MTTFTVRSTGKKVDLNQTNFKAKGGEGSIYVIDDVVYKVCESGKMIAEGKIKELQSLTHPRIVKPEDVLLDSHKKPCGYTMKLVPSFAKPLAQILSKTYRERERVTPELMRDLVQQIADGIRSIHKLPGYLQVDGNEYNYMVTNDHRSAYFIDVNSFQTPNYPADAIMPSIRDYHCPVDPATKMYVWSQNSDWYSFAIISFYMFTGIHPFKGYHPSFPDAKTAMVNQMRAGKSVLESDVRFPLAAVYHPFESVIPGGANGAFMQWYRALFIENKRFPAPLDFQSVITFVTKVQEIIGSNNFDMQEIRKYEGQITGYVSVDNKEIIVTTDHIYVANQPVQRPAERFRVGFTPLHGVPFAAWIDQDRVNVLNLDTKEKIHCDIVGHDLMSIDGRIYIQSMQTISELQFIESNVIFASQKLAATILPNATQLFQGVAFQSLFGSMTASVFPQRNHHRHVKIDDLTGVKITEAKYEGNVLMVIGLDEASGQYSRYIFRFAKDWLSHDLRKIENITPTGINFTVLENGICISITEEEKIEIFSSQKDAVGLKSITDPAVKFDMRLCHSGTQTRFAHGNKLYNFSVRK